MAKKTGKMGLRKDLHHELVRELMESEAESHCEASATSAVRSPRTGTALSDHGAGMRVRGRWSWRHGGIRHASWLPPFLEPQRPPAQALGTGVHDAYQGISTSSSRSCASGGEGRSPRARVHGYEP